VAVKLEIETVNEVEVVGMVKAVITGLVVSVVVIQALLYI